MQLSDQKCRHFSCWEKMQTIDQKCRHFSLWEKMQLSDQKCRHFYCWMKNSVFTSKGWKSRNWNVLTVANRSGTVCWHSGTRGIIVPERYFGVPERLKFFRKKRAFNPDFALFPPHNPIHNSFSLPHTNLSLSIPNPNPTLKLQISHPISEIQLPKPKNLSLP